MYGMYASINIQLCTVYADTQILSSSRPVLKRRLSLPARAPAGSPFLALLWSTHHNRTASSSFRDGGAYRDPMGNADSFRGGMQETSTWLVTDLTHAERTTDPVVSVCPCVSRPSLSL